MKTQQTQHSQKTQEQVQSDNGTSKNEGYTQERQRMLSGDGWRTYPSGFLGMGLFGFDQQYGTRQAGGISRGNGDKVRQASQPDLGKL